MVRNALDGQYALVIDARSEHECAEDHLPCAVSLPVVDNKEYAEVGTTHRTDKHGTGTQQRRCWALSIARLGCIGPG